ncbi:MAG: alanine dehydrogenase [Gemmatimonadota bacterium]
MLIGVPKEIKTNENRIALVPAGAEALTAEGHQVFIEKGAGLGSGFTDAEYKDVGAKILPTADAVWEKAEMIMKVKEPIKPEWPRIKEGQVLFTYFHFAADKALTTAHKKSKSVCIAYETVELPSGELPLLTPMSEVAGRMATQEGAKYLEKFFGGRGVLLGGVPGVSPAEVLVLGGGVVGTHAAKMACGLGAHVTIMDVNLHRLRELADFMPANCDVIYSNRQNILERLPTVDLLIGGILLPGAKAPFLVTKKDLKIMQAGSVIVDVSVDQGGCIETTKPTTHENPIYEVNEVVHYGVANMPGAVPRTSTLALTNATLPYAIQLANKGWKQACLDDDALALGVNLVNGKIVYPAVAEAFGMKWEALEPHLQ